MVYLLPFYHPLRLIEEVCMLDQMSGGRFQLGVGRGVSMYETQAYGLDFAKTQAMYHEAFQVLMMGLTSDELDFKGEFYSFDKLPMILKPAQKPHPPLWYGVTLPGNAAWPAENHVNIVALGLRDHMRTVKNSLSTLESHYANLSTQYANLSNRLNRLDGRIDRIEKRLGLVEA